MTKFKGKVEEVENLRKDRETLREQMNLGMIKMNRQLEGELESRREIKKDYERQSKRLEQAEEENRRFRRTLEDKNRDL